MVDLSALVDIQAFNLALLLALGAGGVRWYRRVNTTLERLDRVLVKLETANDLFVRDYNTRLIRLEDRFVNLHKSA